MTSEPSNFGSLFHTDCLFGTLDEVKQWLNNHGRTIGYVFVTKRSKKNERLGIQNTAYLVCDRGGEYKSTTESTTHSGTKRIGCPFKLVAKYHPRESGWKIRVVCDEHNHEPAKYMEGHAYAKRLSREELHMVEDMTKKNMQPRDILTALKENNKDNVSTIETIYQARQKIRLSNQIGTTPMQSLFGGLHNKGYVHEFRTDQYNQLEDLFFINPTSMDIWRAFPHVLIMDATYNTNKYRLPFLEIVGLTSTNKTFCIAFVFLHKEREDNFAWALSCLRQTLDGYMLPRVIVTDRDLALMNACRKVFPEAKGMLCRYHISENIKKHCRPSFKTQKDMDKFLFRWKVLIESPTIEEYKENWAHLQSSLAECHKNALNYLEVNWINKYKEMFVSAWVDQYLNFGERTTNRVESQHALLKKYLNSPRSSLDKCLDFIDNLVANQYTAIKKSFEESRVKVKHQHKHALFATLVNHISIEALDIISGELKRMNDIQEKGIGCGCHIRSSCGLPCACELTRYLDRRETIPLEAINLFWKKLDFSPASLIPIEEDVRCDKAVQYFLEAFEHQPKPIKKSWLQKLKGILHPSQLKNKEPLIQTNTRGRPPTKLNKHKKLEYPSDQPQLERSCSNVGNYVTYDFTGLSQEPSRHSSYVAGQTPTYDFLGLNQQPPLPSTHINSQPLVYSHHLLHEIPEIFHPYITHVQNVIGDGNCGFRAVSVSMGYSEEYWTHLRHELLDELHSQSERYKHVFTGAYDDTEHSLSFFGPGNAPTEHWMLLPYTGILISNRFNVILHCLSHAVCSTYFPLWKGPLELANYRIITIAHVHGDHFVSVRLQGLYPMPMITTLWSYHRNENASGWETMFWEQLERYRDYLSRNSHTEYINID